MMGGVADVGFTDSLAAIGLTTNSDILSTQRHRDRELHRGFPKNRPTNMDCLNNPLIRNPLIRNPNKAS